MDITTSINQKLNEIKQVENVRIIPADVKHWHGAKKDTLFAHVAIEAPGEET